MANNKSYWKGIEELEKTPDFVENSQKEFKDPIPVDDFLNKEDVASEGTNRRDFLKFLGFSVTAATLAACEAPVTKSIPFLNKPVNLTPGVANYFASTYYDGFDYASILVKTREGRPIFIEGNKKSNLTQGGINARVNTSVLGLYDSKRAKGPAKKVSNAWAKNLSWSEIDKSVSTELRSIASRGGKIALLTNSIISPSSKDVINKFSTNYKALGASVSHVSYDAISSSGILDANAKSFGKRVLPTYNFDKAKVIVSFGADFLGSWLDSVIYTKQFTSRRRPEKSWMNKHFQFESLMSLTGSNADIRGAMKPSEVNSAVLYLYKKLGGSVSLKNNLPEFLKAKLDRAASELKANSGNGLVVSGSNNMGVQIIINAINDKLNNYGTTIDLEKEVYTRQGSDKDFNALATSMNAGGIDALLMVGVNPVYTSPAQTKFLAGLKKVGVKVYFGDRLDETGVESDFLAPDSHYLESWGDYQPTKGEYSLQQPTIKTLFNTRQWQESLLSWIGQGEDFGKYISKFWMATVLKSTSVSKWNAILHDGIYTSTLSEAITVEEVADSVVGEEIKEDVVKNGLSEWISSAVKMASIEGSGFELELYAKTGIGNGNQGLNPWLHEMPDPVSKMTYDNYVSVAPADAMAILGYEDTKDNRRDVLYIGQQSPANVVEVKVGDITLQLPLIPQPGQAKGTLGIAVGYGRRDSVNFTRAEWLGDLWNTDDAAQNTLGKNVFPLLQENLTYLSTISTGVSISLVEGKKYPMATTQTHNTMMGRKLVNETTLAEYLTQKGKAKDKGGYNEQLMVADSYGDTKKPEELDLWAEHAIDLGHRWGLSIDLSTCIGCGACVTACHLENNVPAVGKDEVRRSREMHWLRIDRYYSSNVNDERIDSYYQLDGRQDYLDAEVSEDQPQIAYQPVMCQHCNHAPCETVCPVAATTHSNEGMNQMTYNRCIGTRYCANNCPYKVRRFNWFQYDALNIPAFPDFAKVNIAQDDIGRMVLNPDVVVRSRGVMEKCSLCVQRIQYGKLDAKKAGTKVQNGAIQTACSSSCTTDAISFGDLNDTKHDINKEKEQERAYFLLEEIGVQPNVYYQTKVRNV